MIGTTNWAMPEDYPEEEQFEMSFNGVKFPRQRYELEATMKLEGARATRDAVQQTGGLELR